MKLHSVGLKRAKLLPLYKHIDMKFFWVPVPYETPLPRFGKDFLRGARSFPGMLGGLFGAYCYSTEDCELETAWSISS